ncbi:protein serine/threonine phosphatase 2C, partial [Saccharata proteae CBS 121410]
VEALRLASATARLREGEKTYKMEDGMRFDVNMLASNQPLEDRMAAEIAPGAGKESWQYWGVYDGHAGWECAEILRRSLISQISSQLSVLPANPKNNTTITGAIKRGFNAMDRLIMRSALSAMDKANPATPEAIVALKVAMAGSCALLCMYDPKASILRTACVGDSRAVLGRYDPSTSQYTAHALSTDQTGFNPSEVSRITAAHPGEDDILDPKSGRLLGLAVTRAFGDHRWKWSNDLIISAKKHFFGTGPRPNSRTPPYLTAEPEVTETEIRTGASGDFVIMASDGLWDRISSEDAVECVARWIRAEQNKAFAKMPADGEWGAETGEAGNWRATPEYFVTEDENAATCLMKNAFGGSRRRLFCGVMSLAAPHSRAHRDDVTVQVLFFG